MVFNPKTSKPKKNSTNTTEVAHPRNSNAYSPLSLGQNVDTFKNDIQNPTIDEESFKGFEYTGQVIPPGNK